ncbi:MAG: alpha-2-macroglobulin [Syntrophotaleaceae bacterium]
MGNLLNSFGSVGKKLAGTFSWTPPPWATALNRRRKERPGRFWSGLFLLLILLTGGIAGYLQYLRLPKPLMVSASIEEPGLTPNVEDPRPDPLRIIFSYKTDGLGPGQEVPESPPSVARIDLVNQRLEDGIRLDPAMTGNWSFEGDRTLVFVPEREWPAGSSFTVRLDKKIFVPEIRFSELRYDFQTPAFTITLDDPEFYQDPRDRKIRKAVATLKFSHPVDESSLKKHLTMTMRPADKGAEAAPEEVKYEVTFDRNRREAYVHSVPLELPERSNYLRLTVASGVEPAIGGKASDKDLYRDLLIPDRNSYLKVQEARADIVRNQQDEPQQVLFLRFTDDIAEEELKGKLRIWLLPEENPRHRNRYWSGPREVTEAVLRQSEALNLAPLETEKGFAREYHIPFDVPAERTLYLRLEPGLTSLGGFVHASLYDTLIQPPAYPQEIKLAADGALLSLGGAHQLGLLTRNLGAFRVRIGKLLPGQLQHLISQTRGDIRDPVFQGFSFDQNNLVEYAEQVIDLKPLHPKQANYASVDLTNHLPAGDERFGLFFIEVCGWDKEHRTPMDWISDRRVILVTDLGLLAKDNADQSHEVFVQSVATGKAVAGAQVTLLGRNGLPLLTRSTDQRGHAALPSTKGFENEQEPTVYVVRAGGDMAFIPFERPSRRLNFSRFEVGGARDRQSEEGNGLNAYLFTDRGLYRPGEKVAVGCIVKSGLLDNVEGVPLEIAIRSPRGNEVASRRLNLPEKGFFDYPFVTEPSSETGTYQVALYLVRDQKYRERMIGSGSFRIEEFQPDTLKIQSTLAGVRDEGWSTEKRLTAKVTLRNLFGTPAQGRKVTGFLNVRTARFDFERYPGFIFADPWYDPDKPILEVNEELPAQTIDEEGRAEFTLPLDRFAEGTYLLTLTAEGFEPGGGRSVSARNRVLLSPLETLVGIRPDGRLDYVSQGAERFIDLIAIGSDLERRALKDLKARLIEIRTLSTLVRQPNGTFAYQSVEKEQELSTTDFAIAAEGTRYRLPTNRAGTYVWELIEPQGLKLARVRFSVAGHGNLLGRLEKNAELELKLDRSDYKAGDTIEMNITAPYTGSGLITIESDRVHAWKRFTTDTTSTLQTITVPADLEGNAYVNVAFVRDSGSKEIFTSPLSYAVAPFTIDRGRRTLHVGLEVAEKVRPGARMEIAYNASKPSRIAVFAVDEGILQVAGYRTPQPLDHFLRKRALQVDTLQMLDLILPEFDLIREVSASGGDAASERSKALAANLNPFARALDKPAVFWSGILKADSDRRTVHFTVPDTFSGTLQVMAVAVADGAIGVAQSSSLVRGPFVITPSLLTQAAPGDSFRASANISNILEGSGKNAPVTVRLEASEHLRIVGAKEQRLTISEGDEKTVHFELQAGDRLGAAQVRFLVSSSGEQAARRATLSIRPAIPYSTSMISGFEKDGRVEIEVPRSLYPDLADQQLAASGSPLVLIEGLSSYLEHFPHGCTEQVVSQVFPLVGLMSHPAFAPHSADNQARFAALISRLRERQMADGGFCFWPGGSETAEFPTVYAMHFLHEVRELGYAVPEDLMIRGQDYLREYVGRTPSTLEEARVRAYAVYLLTRMGEVTTNHLVHLQTWLEENHSKTWRQDLAAAYMAASYKLLRKNGEADDLIGRYRLGEAGDKKDGVFHSPLTRDAQFVYLLANHFPPQAAKLDGQNLLPLIEPVFRGRYNTISAAYTILALGAYGKLQHDEGSESIRFTAIDVKGGKKVLTAKAQPLPRASINPGTARVLAEADRALFYLLSQAGFDREPPAAVVRNGLEISRDFLDGEGKPATELSQGQDVTVRLRIRALKERVDNVAVIELMPGGFEVLRDSVPRTAYNWRADYVDVREDRVIFYGSFDTSVRELTYRAKVTSAGEFIVPPPWAEAMYDRAVKAAGEAGHIKVTPE